MTDTDPVRIVIRIKQVRIISGLRGNEPYRKGGDPEDDFPAPLELGPHSRGWYQDEIITWRDSRPRTVQKISEFQDTEQETNHAA